MKRSFVLTAAVGVLVALGAYAPSAGAVSTAGAAPRLKTLNSSGYSEPLCSSHSSLCADPYNSPGGEYVGHDEPSLEFKSGHSGIGQRHDVHVDVAEGPEAATQRKRRRRPTWNFELRPTFWFGLTLCDSASAPEYTKTCAAGLRLQQPRRHEPGRAGLHRQAPRQRVHGVAVLRSGVRPAVRGLRLHRHSYCAAMTIDSRTLNQNTGT